MKFYERERQNLVDSWHMFDIQGLLRLSGLIERSISNQKLKLEKTIDKGERWGCRTNVITGIGTIPVL